MQMRGHGKKGKSKENNKKCRAKEARPKTTKSND